MDYLDSMINERAILNEKIERLEKEIKKSNFPDGYLSFNKNGDYYKRYQVMRVDGQRVRKFLTSKNKKLIEQLALKGYKECELQTLKKKLKATEAYISEYPQNSEGEFLKNKPGYKEILLPLLESMNRSMEEKLKHWEMAPNPGNLSHPEHLIFPTIKGIMVRSKSESLISDELFRASIPYRYEYLIRLGNTLISPDFMIMHPITKEIYIWEHFGRMDDPEYVNNNFLKKMRLYPNEGYIPSINLICTYETSNHPLTIFEVDEIITKYFR